MRRVSKKRAARAVAYSAFRLGILARDGYRCQYCRTRQGVLDPHHVTKRSQGGALCDPDNVVTLCRRHHDQTDAAYATGRLMVTALGHGRFAFRLAFAADKFAARDDTAREGTGVGTPLTSRISQQRGDLS